MKPKMWMAIVVVLVLVNIATIAFLWINFKHISRQGHKGGSAKDFIVKEVGLNEQQQQQYDALRKKHHSEMVRLDETNRQLHDQLFDNVSNNIADQAFIDSAVKQIGHVEAEKQKITFYHFRELRKLLQADQQQKFDNVLKQALRILARPGPPPPGHFPPHGNGPDEK